MSQSLEPIVLVSCYELGHQPAGLALPAGFLRDAGIAVSTLDISVERFDPVLLKRARFVGISVPMHTALRLGVRIAEEIRTVNSDCHICFYGLYAHLNANHLLDTVADSVVGGEFEEPLLQLVLSLDKIERDPATPIEGVSTKLVQAVPFLRRLQFRPAYRDTLPDLARYARLSINGEERLAGYVEASRGCLHHCTHCPIPPVYNGRFFVVPSETVIEDIRALISKGAQHITFGDPDFLNGPGHSLRIAREMHSLFPDITFDFTAKVEHILKYRSQLSELSRLGCLFLVSALESLSDVVLEHLDKGHTRADIFAALRVVRDAGMTLRPSFVSFTPWTTIDDYAEMLEFVESEGLIDCVDPVQYSIRLLVPPGSLLLSASGTERWIGDLNPASLSYRWQHQDPRVEDLHQEVCRLVEEAAFKTEDPSITFNRICDATYAFKGDNGALRINRHLPLVRMRPPRLTEAWFC